MGFITINKFAKAIGKTPQTLRNWDAQGILKPHHKSPNGYRYYTKEQLDNYLGKEVVKRGTGKKVVGYCRVSSNKKKDDLERQVENMQLYLSANGEPYEIITDVGSGINYNKRGLKKLIELINNGEISKVVVLYKDRLVRFGFEIIEYIAELNDCEIEVIDYTEKTEEQELVEDLVQIVTVFSCKLHGKRARKTRKMIEELVMDDDCNT